MQRDPWGHALGTDSADAAAAVAAAALSYVAWHTDTNEHLNAAIGADPDFALPRAMKAILMAGLRKPELGPPAGKQLAAARAARPPADARERLYLDAAEAAVAGEVTRAAAGYEAIARAHPHDLFALRLAQFELFWIGEAAWMRDISERAAPDWDAGVPGFAAFQAIRAFGLEEAGAYAAAEACGRDAVARDPADPWGAHAVAHVLIMQGRLEDGIGFVSGLSGNWERANHIRHHLWWHLALFHAERRDHAAVLEIYDRRLRDLASPLMQAVPDFYVDIQNDVALLQRLELLGVDVGARWAPVADLAAARIGNHLSPFTSAHAALALAAAGRFREADELVEAARDFAASGATALAPRYALAAVPAAAAAVAFRRGEHARAVDILTPARRNLWQMGGSHAQRDLFFQIFAAAARAAGRREVLALILDEVRGIGFGHLAERASYADALAALN